jgi:hypothetical protein
VSVRALTWIFRPRKAAADLTAAINARDFAEPDSETLEDHAVHAEGERCARCGRLIEAWEPARRRGQGQVMWVHDMCPRDDE